MLGNAQGMRVFLTSALIFPVWDAVRTSSYHFSQGNRRIQEMCVIPVVTLQIFQAGLMKSKNMGGIWHELSLLL